MDKSFRTRLDRMFCPRSVAVIGAGDSPDKVGHAIVDSLITGGFPGPVYPIHPRHKQIMGLRVYRDLDDLPDVPVVVDLLWSGGLNRLSRNAPDSGR